MNSVEVDTANYYKRQGDLEQAWENTEAERKEAIIDRRDEIVESVWNGFDNDYNLLCEQRVNDAFRDLLENHTGDINQMPVSQVVSIAKDAMAFLRAIEIEATQIAETEIEDSWEV